MDLLNRGDWWSSALPQLNAGFEGSSGLDVAMSRARVADLMDKSDWDAIVAHLGPSERVLRVVAGWTAFAELLGRESDQTRRSVTYVLRPSRFPEATITSRLPALGAALAAVADSRVDLLARDSSELIQTYLSMTTANAEAPARSTVISWSDSTGVAREVRRFVLHLVAQVYDQELAWRMDPESWSALPWTDFPDAAEALGRDVELATTPTVPSVAEDRLRIASSQAWKELWSPMNWDEMWDFLNEDANAIEWSASLDRMWAANSADELEQRLYDHVSLLTRGGFGVLRLLPNKALVLGTNGVALLATAASFALNHGDTAPIVADVATAAGALGLPIGALDQIAYRNSNGRLKRSAAV